MVDDPAKIASPDSEVLAGLVEPLDADALLIVPGRAGHHLRQADGAHGAGGVCVEVALQLDQAEGQVWIDAFGPGDVDDGFGQASPDSVLGGVRDDLVGPLELCFRQIQLSAGRVELSRQRPIGAQIDAKTGASGHRGCLSRRGGRLAVAKEQPNGDKKTHGEHHLFYAGAPPHSISAMHIRASECFHKLNPGKVLASQVQLAAPSAYSATAVTSTP